MKNNGSRERGSFVVMIVAVAGAIAAWLFARPRQRALARSTVAPTGKKI